MCSKWLKKLFFLCYQGNLSSAQVKGANSLGRGDEDSLSKSMLCGWMSHEEKKEKVAWSNEFKKSQIK